MLEGARGRKSREWDISALYIVRIVLSRGGCGSPVGGCHLQLRITEQVGRCYELNRHCAPSDWLPAKTWDFPRTRNEK